LDQEKVSLEILFGSVVYHIALIEAAEEPFYVSSHTQQQSGLRAFFIASLFRGGGVKVTVTSRKVEPEERREPSSDLCIGKWTLPLLAIFPFAPCAHGCLSLYSAV